MTREEYNKRRKEAVDRHTADQYGYYSEMMDVDYDYIASLEARIEELEQELKNQVELHNGWLGTYRIKLDYIEELERKIKRLTT